MVLEWFWNDWTAKDESMGPWPSSWGVNPESYRTAWDSGQGAARIRHRSPRGALQGTPLGEILGHQVPASRSGPMPGIGGQTDVRSQREDHDSWARVGAQRGRVRPAGRNLGGRPFPGRRPPRVTRQHRRPAGGGRRRRRRCPRDERTHCPRLPGGHHRGSRPPPHGLPDEAPHARRDWNPAPQARSGAASTEWRPEKRPSPQLAVS